MVRHARRPVRGPSPHRGLGSGAALEDAGGVAVEPTEVLERVKARRLDRGAQFALVAAMEAWADSGLDQGGVEAERLGVAVATGIGGVQTLLDQHDNLRDKASAGSPRCRCRC